MSVMETRDVAVREGVNLKTRKSSLSNKANYFNRTSACRCLTGELFILLLRLHFNLICQDVRSHWLFYCNHEHDIEMVS